MGTTALLDLLDQAAVAYQSVPLWLLVTGHCLSVVTLFRGYSPFWLVGWLVGFIACFGGGTSSALLLQSPSVAAVGLFARNEIGVCYTLCWWTVNYCPGGAWAAELPPIRTAAKLLRAILRATTVVQRVNAAVMLHPGVIAAPLVLGTLSACGGGLLVDAFSHCAGYPVKGPYELSHPGYGLRSAVLGTLCHYFLVHVTGVLSSQQGLGLVITLYAAHSLATDLTGQPCDYTAALGSLFHKITLIPAPADGSPAAAKPASTPSAKGEEHKSTRRRAAAAPVAFSEASGDEGQQAAPPRAAAMRTTRRRSAAAATAR